MTRIAPLKREELTEQEPVFQMVEAAMGFVPNSMLTMARKPGLLEAFGGLGAVVLAGNTLPDGLAQMVAFMSSHAAGCRYCQAHTHHTAAHQGVAADKLAAIWAYETDPHFSDAERAALRLAQAAGQVPNMASDKDFEELKKHFSEQQIVEIVAVISLFGYLNRWNDTMATALEPQPLSHGQASLAESGWTPGKHV